MFGLARVANLFWGKAALSDTGRTLEEKNTDTSHHIISWDGSKNKLWKGHIYGGKMLRHKERMSLHGIVML